MSIFVTGTDSGVGKTVITAGLAGVLQSLGYNVGVYKPIQVGMNPKTPNYMNSMDLDFVSKVDSNIFTKCSYVLRSPVAPAIGAIIDSINIDFNIIVRDYKFLCEQCDFVIVEGTGSISTPINADATFKDLIKLLDLPVITVTNSSASSINNIILAIEYSRMYNLKLLGIILSDFPVKAKNDSMKYLPEIITGFTKLEILGILPQIKDLNIEEPQSEVLIEEIIKNVNLEKVFGVKIPKISEFY